MIPTWIQQHAGDVLALLFHALSFAGYRVLQRTRGRRNPRATLQSQQSRLRAAWTAEVVGGRHGILAVQTIRNAMMAAVFFASNTMFLVLGSLTLIAQGNLAESWALLDPEGMRPAPLAQAKMVVLLLTLLVAFFCFLSAIRLFSHASLSAGVSSVEADHVTAQLDTAWRYQGIGVRCYYFGAPILFWLFGAIWLPLASLGALALMHAFDSVPSRE